MYRQNGEISATSSGDLNKYEYLTNKDLGYKPDPIRKAKFEYSSLGQVFNKGLDSSEKQEGLLKSLKKIENKTDNQLRAIEDQQDRQLDLIDEINAGRTISIGFQNERLKNLEKDTTNKEKEIRKNKKIKKKEDKDKAIFSYTATDGKPFDFSDDTKLLNFAEDLYRQDLSFDEAKEEQKNMLEKINELKKIINLRTVPKPKDSNKKKRKILSQMQKIFIILKMK